jgi:hypothetical protein
MLEDTPSGCCAGSEGAGGGPLRLQGFTVDEISTQVGRTGNASAGFSIVKDRLQRMRDNDAA